MTRTIWWAALIIGAAYLLPVVMGWNGPAITAWKGTAVGLLALWAGVQARSTDGWMITAVLAFGALGDVMLNIYGLKAGAVLFVIAHLVAIGLYWRNMRAEKTSTQKALAALLIPAVIIIVWAMARDNPDWPIAVAYVLFAAAMASMAWISSFPRYRTGIGALLFVASDIAIIAGQAELLPVELRRVMVWPLYFAAQALIAWGVVTTLRRAQEQAELIEASR